MDSHEHILVGYSFTVIMNFKIGKSDLVEDDIDIERISHLVILNFSNNASITVDLKISIFFNC